MRDAIALPELHCRKCDYMLTGLASDGLCPECGLLVSESRLPATFGYLSWHAMARLRLALGCMMIGVLVDTLCRIANTLHLRYYLQYFFPAGYTMTARVASLYGLGFSVANALEFIGMAAAVYFVARPKSNLAKWSVGGYFALAGVMCMICPFPLSVYYRFESVSKSIGFSASMAFLPFVCGLAAMRVLLSIALLRIVNRRLTWLRLVMWLGLIGSIAFAFASILTDAWRFIIALPDYPEIWDQWMTTIFIKDSSHNFARIGRLVSLLSVGIILFQMSNLVARRTASDDSAQDASIRS